MLNSIKKLLLLLFGLIAAVVAAVVGLIMILFSFIMFWGAVGFIALWAIMCAVIEWIKE